MKILSALDDKIELNNRINAELEAMAKTLYDYWFVQFDFPIVTSSGVEKPYKASGGKMVYNETLKREIPGMNSYKIAEKFAKMLNDPEETKLVCVVETWKLYPKENEETTKN